MRKLLVAVVLALALLAPAAAQAHPLGNFTVNHYTRIEPSGDRVYLLYVLDLAEIPTYQARPDVARLGVDGYAAGLAREIAASVSLTLDGAEQPLSELRHAIAFPEGAGGLRTTRLEVVLETGPVDGPAALAYADGYGAGRIGWKEVVLTPTAGATVSGATVPAASVSDELHAYPRDLLASPLEVTAASAELTPGETAGPPPALLDEAELRAPARTASASESGFASLIAKENLGVGVVLVSILVAMFWGAAHALSPGHGKAIVAAYLVGARGTPRQAVYLGLITTATHTIGVFALGLVTLALSELIVPEDLYPWLNLVSAILVVAVGATVLRGRIRDWRHHRHHHHHPHHEHDHDHHHHREPGTGWRGLVAVGVSGGLLPCPTALVVLLAAISLHRVGYGLVLIVAFSIGLAATITGIGLLAISARRLARRIDFQGPVVRFLPAVSALVILGVGIAMTVRALPGVS